MDTLNTEILMQIERYRKGARPFFNWQPNVLEQVITHLESSPEKNLFFGLRWQNRPDFSIGKRTLTIIKTEKMEEETWSIALECLKFHLIEGSKISGDSLPKDFYKWSEHSLKTLSGERLTWFLRFTSELGPRVRKLLPVLKKIRPSVLSFSHQKRLQGSIIRSIFEQLPKNLRS